MALSQAKAASLRGINKIIAGSFIVVLTVSCLDRNKETLPFYNSADFTADWIEKEDARYAAIHTIDTFSMRDQLGHIFKSDSLKGKIYVANFFFTACPSICPRMTHELSILQASILNNPSVEIISFSVMPWSDSISVLKEYADRNEIVAKKWHLLTGDESKIKKLGRKSYFAEKSLGLTKSLSDFLHTENAVLIDKQSRIRGVYNATKREDVSRMIADIGILEVE